MSNLIFTPPLPTASSRPLPAVVCMVQAVVHYRHLTKDSFTTLTLQTNQTERPNFTNRLRPTNYYQSMLLESYSQEHHSKTDQSIYANWTKHIQLTATISLTLMMTSSQVVETSVTTTENSPSHDYTYWTIKPHYYT